MGAICTRSSAVRNEPFICTVVTQKHLICDSTHDRISLQRFLHSTGVQTDYAVTTEQCIDHVRCNGQYAILWMDMAMPSAVRCAHLLRRSMYTGVIVGLTSYVSEEMHNEFMACGVTYFMKKPFDVNLVRLYSSIFKQRVTIPKTVPPHIRGSASSAPESGTFSTAIHHPLRRHSD